MAKVRATKEGFSGGHTRVVGEVFPAPLDPKGKPITKASWFEPVDAKAKIGVPERVVEKGTEPKVVKGEFQSPDGGVSGGGGKNAVKPKEVEPESDDDLVG